MTETLLIILAIELGAIFFAMVGIFALETYALYQRSKEDRMGHGGLHIMTREEALAHGLNPKEFMNGAKIEPLPVAAIGQYL
jgi:hypothetical protein